MKNLYDYKANKAVEYVKGRIIEVSELLVLSGNVNTHTIKAMAQLEADVFNVKLSDKEMDELVTTGMLRAMKN